MKFSLTPGGATDFRVRANYYLALTAMVLLLPFSANNILQGRFLLGFGAAVIVVVLAIKAWLIRQNRYTELFSILVLVPVILIFLSVSIQNQGIIGILWSYPGLVAFFLLLSERNALIASALLVALVVPQAAMVLDTGLAARTAVTLIAVAIFTAIFVHAMTVAQDKLQKQATTDPLTGLLNRTLLLESIAHAIEQNRRHETPMTLLACDIDHFKPINDEFGHAAGDEVLANIGQLLIARFRKVDRAFRTGGEEFLVILSGTDMETGQRVAEELCQTIEAKELLRDRKVTISVGVASLEEEDHAESWLQRADEHLYEAKRDGRNRVVARNAAGPDRTIEAKSG